MALRAEYEQTARVADLIRLALDLLLIFILQLAERLSCRKDLFIIRFRKALHAKTGGQEHVSLGTGKNGLGSGVAKIRGQ